MSVINVYFCFDKTVAAWMDQDDDQLDQHLLAGQSSYTVA
jgi:hypothetical protein